MRRGSSRGLGNGRLQHKSKCQWDGKGKELYQSFSFSDPYFGHRFVPGARAVGRGSWRREVELSDSEDESQIQL